MARKIIVTSHEGTIKWMAENGVKASKIVMDSFDPSTVKPTDTVIGTLPLHLAAEVIRRGGRYWNFVLDIPRSLRRKKELTAEDIAQCRPRFEEFRISSAGERSPRQPDPMAAPVELPVTMICIASGQTLPNILPFVQRRWDRLVIYRTPEMIGMAERLARLAQEMKVSPEGISFRDIPEGMDFAGLSRYFHSEVELLTVSDEHHDSAWVVNLTGGHKLLTLACSDAFRSHAELIYCDGNHGRIDIIDPPGRDAEPIRGDALSVEQYLKAQGFRIQRWIKPGATAEETVRSRASLTATLVLEKGMRRVRNPDQPGDLRSFLHRVAATIDDLVVEGKPGALTLPDPHFGDPLKQMLVHLAKAGIVSRFDLSGQAGTVTIEMPDRAAAKYLSGGYLEEFVFLAATALGLPAEAIAMGVEVDPEDAAPRPLSYNEIDVAIVWRGRMLMIECKAGSLRYERPQQISNRLESLRRLVAGALGRAWLLTARKLEPDADGELVQRAKTAGFDIIAGDAGVEAITDKLSALLGLPSEAVDWPPKRLYIKWPAAPGGRPITTSRSGRSERGPAKQIDEEPKAKKFQKAGRGRSQGVKVRARDQDWD